MRARWALPGRRATTTVVAGRGAGGSGRTRAVCGEGDAVRPADGRETNGGGVRRCRGMGAL
jgi:hypothetical protein